MSGSLEFIFGCMYSGKTEELLRRVRLELIGHKNVQLFKSHRDSRYSTEKIYSHNERSIEAITVGANPLEPHRSSSSDLLSKVAFDSNMIAIDEIQFFDDQIVQVCEELANSGKKVIVAGLVLDFRGEPFGHHTLNLLAKADALEMLMAICTVCGEDATMTQRLVNGNPASWADPIYMDGGFDDYQAVCRKHHIIQRPPKNSSSQNYQVLDKPPGPKTF